ncbi:unnamed protein product [Paramecium sonneborni]|uniref:Uncharacterized protein n=1 Tax=Paramecium sonneborni TaxID=65129 RepID=A0A8S1REW3_9CILI|nr:unnamed protein product [Paramecium sonneborni]
MFEMIIQLRINYLLLSLLYQKIFGLIQNIRQHYLEHQVNQLIHQYLLFFMEFR